MLETLSAYAVLSPWSVGLLLFPLGLAVGSFSSVLWHRLPRGESIVTPGSRCTACGHGLSARDLVPLLSWLWLRGRCRYCSANISWRYPALEAGSGFVAALVGGLLGWGAGFASLIVWVSATVFLSGRLRRRRGLAESGMTLVEVLMATGLIVAVMVPMMDFAAFVRGGSTYPRQIALTLAGSKLEELRYESLNTWPPLGGQRLGQSVGKYQFDLTWSVAVTTPPDSVDMATVGVTVTCFNCTRPMPPVRMVTNIAQP